MKKFISVLISLILILVFAASVFAAESQGTASTVSLEKAEGTVSVVNSSGKSVSTRNGMRLYSGYTISTGAGSSAYISLDSKKAVLLEASSKMSLKKSGNKIDVMLESGTVVADISESLNKNESLNIHTTNMVTGIRGTGVEVSYFPRAIMTRINMIHGSTLSFSKFIHNLVTAVQGEGFTAGADVSVTTKPGSIILSDLMPQTQALFIVQKEASSPVMQGFNEEFLTGNESDAELEALGRVISNTVNVQANEQQAADDAAGKAAEDAVSAGVSVVVDPVFGGQNAADGSSAVAANLPEEQTAGSSSDAAIEPVPAPVQETVYTAETAPETAADLQELLNTYTKVIIPGDAEYDGITVPAGKTLEISSGTVSMTNMTNNGTVIVDEGATLVFAGGTNNNYGTINNNGSLINEEGSTLYNYSANTINNNGEFTNRGIFINMPGRFVNSGSFINSGTVTNTNGTINNTGKISNSGTITKDGTITGWDLYTITWKNADGTILEIDKDLAEGDLVAYYVGHDPVLKADAQYSYEFIGWDPAPAEFVSGNATYTAIYDAHERIYGEPEWNWTGSDAEGYTAASAVFTTDDEFEVFTQTETDSDLSLEQTDATCTEAGTKVYTASVTFFNDEYTAEKSVEIAATGHNWGEPAWNWAKDHTTAAAIFTCSTDSTHTETVEAAVETAEAADKYTYTATVTLDGKTYTDVQTETRYYTITWWQDNEEVIDATVFAYGVTPTHADAEKAATSKYTYTFTGWDPKLAPVNGDTVYKAVYSETPVEYTVTYKVDGEVYGEVDNVAYGSELSPRTAPAKEGYTFSGWSEIPETMPDSNVEITGTFTINTYTVTWMNGETVIKTDEAVEYGTTPAYDGQTPTKAATAEYTYTFAGWTPAVAKVTTNAAYTATFTAVKNKYTVTWNDENGEQIGSEQLEYGSTPTHAAITKDATAEYTYTFAGWTPSLTTVTTNAAYTATFSAVKNKYTVSFLKDDGTEISSDELEYGTRPTAPADITKDATAEYTYTFTGWTPAVTTVTTNAAYMATFSAVKNKYTVSFLKDDGAEISRAELEYGAEPTAPADVTKEATAEYTYTFAGWSPAVTSVTTNAAYTATFSAVKNKYTVTWNDENGEQIGSEQLEYGSTPTHAAITKDATAEYTYTFAGWTPSITTVTTNAAYTATFSAVVNTYTVTWKNEDGTILETDENIPYDTTPEYNGEVPAKEADEQYTYAFLAWDKELTAVTGDVTYTATFESITRTYGVYWNNWDGSPLWISTGVPYGTVPEYPEGEVDGVPVPVPSHDADAQYTYTFNGWDPAPVKVTGAATYTATYSAVVNKYSVAFVDEDGSTILKPAAQYDYGTAADDIVKPDNPTKEATVDKVYTFSAWAPTIENVTKDVTYTAIYSEEARTYTVTWQDYDNTVLVTSPAVYGSDASYAGTTPTRAATAEYTYTFAGWLPTPVAISADTVTVATYTAVKNQYTITWNDADGKQLSTEQIEYGSTPTHAAITKDATAEYTYNFAGWTPEIATVTTNAAYTATFSAVKNKYDVSWQNEDGSVISTESLEYGSTPEFSGTEPTKAATAEYTYTFAGWTPAVAEVTTNAAYTVTFSAVKNKYNVTFVDEDGTTVLKAATAYDYGTAVADIAKPADPTKEATVDKVFTFSGWAPTIEDVTKAATYAAIYSEAARSYTLTWQDYDNTVLSTSSAVYGSNASYQGTAPARDATAEYTYNFNGWTPALARVTGDATYTATYTAVKNSYTVTFNTNGGSELEDMTVEYGSLLTDVREPEKEGFNFIGWSTKEDLSDSFNLKTDVVEGTMTLYAIWEDKYLNVTFNADGGVPIPKAQNVKYGDNASEPDEAPAKDGYRFDGWYETDEAEAFSFDTQIKVETVLTARWIKTYSVTFNYNDEGATSSAAVTVDEGAAVAEPADPERAGYTFEGWYIVSDTAETEYVFTTEVTGDIELKAHWTANSVTVTAPYMTPQRSSMVLVSLTDGTNTQSSDQSDFPLSTTVGTPITLTITNYDQYIVAVTPSAIDGITITQSASAANVYSITGFTDDFVLSFDVAVKKPLNDEEHSLTEFAGLYYDSNDTTGLSSLTCLYPENVDADLIPTGGFVSYKPYEVYFTVTFVDEEGNGTDRTGQRIRYNGTVVKPADPTYSGNETNLSFLGWCSDSDRTMLYDFNSPVTEDLMLYAKWGVRTLNMHVPYMVSPDEDGMNVYPIGEDAQYTTRTSDDCSMSFTEGSEIPVKISFDPVYMSVTDVSVITSGGGVGISVEHSDIIIRDGQQMQYKNATISGITEDFDLLLDMTIKLLDGSDASSVIGSYFSNFNGIAHITALLPDSIDPSDVPEETDSLSVEFYKTPIDITVPTVPDGLGEQPIGIFLYSADGEMLEYGINTPNVYSTDTETLYVGIDVNRYIINNYTTGAGVVYAPNVTDAAVSFVAIGNDSIPEVIETNEDVKFFKTTDLSSDFTLGIDITITLDKLGSEATPTTLYQSLALLALDGSAKSITIYYKEDDTAPASVEITLRNGISSALSSTGYDANGEAINKFSFEAY